MRLIQPQQRTLLMADEESVRFPEGIGLYEDKAFEGYAPDGLRIYRPKKKPQGGELTMETVPVKKVIK